MKNMALLHCTDECTKKSFIEFNHDGLQQKVNKLQSSLSHELMQDTFKDLFEGIESLKSTEFLQMDAQISPIINKTKFSNPPVPRTKVPGILVKTLGLVPPLQRTSALPSAPSRSHHSVTNCIKGSCLSSLALKMRGVSSWSTSIC